MSDSERHHQINPAEPITLETLLNVQHATAHSVNAARELLEVARRLEKPADLETITFTPQQWIVEKGPQVEEPALSVGVLNPTPLPIFVGLRGETPSPGNRTPICPPFSLLVLPVHGWQVELGVDPLVLGQQTISAFLMRFSSVQPAVLASASSAPVDVADRAARALGRVAIIEDPSTISAHVDATTRGLSSVEQGGIADTLQAVGSLNAPAAGAAIATLLALPAGVYSLQVITLAVGDAAQPANLQLQRGGAPVGGLLSPSTPTPVTRERITVGAGQALTVNTLAAAAAGSVYAAFIAATRIA